MALDLKAKWGPLPVWAWGAIAGATGLIGYYLYSRSTGGSSDAGTAQGSYSGSAPTIDSQGYQTAGIKGGQATTETTSPETNMGWVARVGRWVADSIGASQVDVSNALYKYVTAQDLTTTEKAYVDKAVAIGMAPPEGVQGVANVVAPLRTLTRYIRNPDGGIAGEYSDGTGDALNINEWVQLTANGAKAEQLSYADFSKVRLVS